MSASKIREILQVHGRLPQPIDDLSNESDLYQAGLTSMATVGLMLALEDEFDIEFPDALLNRATFGSIASIEDTIDQLRQREHH